MADRREPQAREILRRLEGDLAPHGLEHLAEQLAAEMARTPDTAGVTLAVPALGEHAKVVIRGFPPTLGQRLRRKLAK